MGLTQTGTDGIKDDAITLAKQAAGTDGQIITYDASGNPVAVGPGTDGQVLTSTGAGSPPAFEDIPAKAALTGSTNNTITTVTGANAIQGEANLTFDGSTLLLNAAAVTNTNDVLTVKKAASGFGEMSMTVDANTSTSSAANAFIFTKSKHTYWNGYGFQSSHGHIGGIVGKRDSAGGDSDQEIRIEIGGTGINASQEKTWNFQNNGNFTISDGSLVLGTGGHGIDWSANGHASGMSSETLHSYEEGTWTPDFFYHSSVANITGQYTKIGRMVYAYFAGNYYSNSSSAQYISNLPFTAVNISGGVGGVARGYQNYDIQNGPIYFIEGNTTKLWFYKDNGVGFPASDGDGKSFRGMVVYTAAS